MKTLKIKMYYPASEADMQEQQGAPSAVAYRLQFDSHELMDQFINALDEEHVDYKRNHTQNVDGKVRTTVRFIISSKDSMLKMFAMILQYLDKDDNETPQQVAINVLVGM